MSNKPNFKAIFFDNDGLLVNTEPLYLQAIQDVLGPLGIEITREWYIRENLGKGTSTFLLAEEKGLPEERIKELRHARNERYSELLKDGVKPMEGVSEVLETLRENFVMGVVTSSRKDHFNIIMEQTGLRKYFSFFITGNDVEHTKPHPEPYLKAVALAGVEKEHCLVLEDAYRGVRAAKAAGLTCYAIPDALTREHNFSIADNVLGNIRELPDLILPVKSEIS